MKTFLNAFFFVFISLSLSAQTIPSPKSVKEPIIKTELLAPLISYKSEEAPNKQVSFLRIYDESLGVFCKAENLMAKKNPIKLKMRLGSVQYVDKLELKNRYYK